MLAGRGPAFLRELFQKIVTSLEIVAAESEEWGLLEEREENSRHRWVNKKEEDQYRSYKASTKQPHWNPGTESPEQRYE